MHLRNIDNDVFASKIDRSGCRIAPAALQIAPNSMNHETFNLNIQITMEIKNPTFSTNYWQRTPSVLPSSGEEGLGVVAIRLR